MQKKHMERCLFTLIVLLIFALTILGLYRVTKHSAAPASTTIPAVFPAASPADAPTATSSPTPNPVPSPTPAPPDRVDSYAVQGIEVASHQSDTMHWRIERIEQEDAVCYLTKIYLLDPGTQIRKATANWERDIQYPVDMAAKIPDATLFINGSGYVSPTFPEIPSNYPGSSPDYYYTPLGSVTVTDGQLFRCLTGVPYYGLSLTRDGLHMHVGDDPGGCARRQSHADVVILHRVSGHPRPSVHPRPELALHNRARHAHHHQLHRRAQFHPADSHARQQQRPDHAPVR